MSAEAIDRTIGRFIAEPKTVIPQIKPEGFLGTQTFLLRPAGWLTEEVIDLGHRVWNPEVGIMAAVSLVVEEMIMLAGQKTSLLEWVYTPVLPVERLLQDFILGKLS
jgi:hypothetical protein